MEFAMQTPAIFAHPELDEEKLVNQDGEDEVKAPDPDTVVDDEDDDDDEEEDGSEEKGAEAE